MWNWIVKKVNITFIKKELISINQRLKYSTKQNSIKIIEEILYVFI
jgi:hypothetical protein